MLRSKWFRHFLFTPLSGKPLDQARSNRRRDKRRLSIESLEERRPLTVKFLFDFSLDTQGFFNDPARRSALVQAGNMLTDRFDDALAAITPSGSNTWRPTLNHPATGAQVNASRTSIPANTIVVYAGARNLSGGTIAMGGSGGFSASGSQAWFNTIRGRGQAGALANTPTDVAPWGGSITFDSQGVDWNFSTTSTGLTSGKTDFFSVAMHELAHVMGAGLSGSWNRLISGSNFVGATASARNGGPVPLAGNGAHFREGLVNQKVEVAMDPTLTTGTRKFFSNLDFGALIDIGWFTDFRDDTIPRAPNVLSRRTGNTNPTDTTVINNAIGFDRDVDMLRVYADAGMQLSASSITPSGGQAVDTYLRIFSATGQELATGNQGAAGGTDTATFNITRSDYYYVGISSAASRNYNPHAQDTAPRGPVGDYRMTITLRNTPSGNRGASISSLSAPSADMVYAAWLNSQLAAEDTTKLGKKRA